MIRLYHLIATLFLLPSFAVSAEPPADHSNTVARWPAERAKCRPVPLGDVRIGGFLGKRIDQNLPSLMAGLGDFHPARVRGPRRGQGSAP